MAERPPHAAPAVAVAAALATDLERGLSSVEVAARLARYGPNQIGRAHV